MEVFSEELLGIVLEPLEEAFSTEQAVRTALVAVAGGAAASQQLRGLTRDVTNRDLGFRVAVSRSSADGRPSLRLEPKEAALALLAVAAGRRDGRRR